MSDSPSFLATEMGVSRRTVQRWCAVGNVPGAYRTKGGHWRIRKPRRKINSESKIERLIMLHFMLPARPSPPLTWRELLERLRWILEWQISDEMEALVNSQAFNDALEFSLVVNQCSCDDLRDAVDLRKRDAEKFSYLIGEQIGDILRPRPLLDMLIPGAYKATNHPNATLAVKAYKLALNGRSATSAALARELKISVAELYRRYRCADLHRVKRANQRATSSDDVLQNHPFSYTHHPVDDLEPLRG